MTGLAVHFPFVFLSRCLAQNVRNHVLLHPSWTPWMAICTPECTCGKTTEKFRQMHVSEINTLNLIMSTLWLNTLMSFNLCRKIVWSAAYKFHPLHDKTRPTESFLEESPSTKKLFTHLFLSTFPGYMRVVPEAPRYQNSWFPSFSFHHGCWGSLVLLERRVSLP